MYDHLNDTADPKAEFLQASQDGQLEKCQRLVQQHSFTIDELIRVNHYQSWKNTVRGEQ